MKFVRRAMRLIVAIRGAVGSGSGSASLNFSRNTNSQYLGLF